MPLHSQPQLQRNKHPPRLLHRQASSSLRALSSPKDHGLPLPHPLHPSHRVTVQHGPILKQTMLRPALQSQLRPRCSPHRSKSRLNQYQQSLRIPSQPPVFHSLKQAHRQSRTPSPLHQLRSTLRMLLTRLSSKSSMTCPLSKLPQPSRQQRARFPQRSPAPKLSQASPLDQTCPSQVFNCQASSTRLSVQSAALTFPRLQRSGSSKAA